MISGIVYFNQDCLNDLLSDMIRNVYPLEGIKVYTRMTLKSIYYKHKSVETLNADNDINICIVLIDELIRAF